MTREGALAVIVVATLVLLGLIWWGWRRRSRRDRGLIAPLEVPGDAAVIASFSALYVATTRHGAPLDRLAIRHLSFRSRVDVDVTDRGVGIALTGEPVVFLPTERLTGVGRATWTIDRVTEPGGLVFVAWRVSDEVEADTSFRLQDDDPGAFVDAVNSILPTPAPTGTES